jgi:hypothetical protein
VEDTPQTDESKQEAEAADPHITQPTTAPPQIPPAGTKTGEAGGDQKPSQPTPAQLVGGNDLIPFEQQTVAIARESLAISRRTYWIAVLGFGAALAAAVFVGSQVKIMSYQTQVMGSQSESAAGVQP